MDKVGGGRTPYPGPYSPPFISRLALVSKTDDPLIVAHCTFVTLFHTPSAYP